MDSVFKKLNFKAHKLVLVIGAPSSFNVNLDSIRNECSVVSSTDGLDKTDFCMIFVTKQVEVNEIIPVIVPLLTADAVLWMCYPKGTSKKYKCDFNRDTGWQIMGKFDLEPVRMVAIDEDWSAIRFKNVDNIIEMKRNSQHALSEKGKIKTNQSE
jgi:hypothetical protein